MKPNPTIVFLLDQAKEHYEKTTRDLGFATQKRDKELQKTSLLEGYLQEYRDRLQQGSEHGMRVSDLVNFQAFIAKLTDALEQQQRALFMSERNLDRVRELWREANRRMKSFEILLERRRTAAQLAETRREQREMDAYAARASLIRQSVY
jgi:flagellar export protein FliJ